MSHKLDEKSHRGIKGILENYNKEIQKNINSLEIKKNNSIILQDRKTPSTKLNLIIEYKIQSLISKEINHKMPKNTKNLQKSSIISRTS